MVDSRTRVRERLSPPAIALVAAAILLCVGAPVDVRAQSLSLDSSVPLQIYCLTDAQEYCVSFLTWETAITQRTGPDGTAVNCCATWSTTFVVHGAGIEAGPTGLTMLAWVPLPGGDPYDAIGMFDQATVDGAGEYSLADASGAASTGVYEGTPPAPSVNDLQLMAFSTVGACAGPSSTSETLRRCVEVPEPAVGLLLAGALLLGSLLWWPDPSRDRAA